jgi:hypothetical protein
MAHEELHEPGQRKTLLGTFPEFIPFSDMPTILSNLRDFMASGVQRHVLPGVGDDAIINLSNILNPPPTRTTTDIGGRYGAGPLTPGFFEDPELTTGQQLQQRQAPWGSFDWDPKAAEAAAQVGAVVKPPEPPSPPEPIPPVAIEASAVPVGTLTQAQINELRNEAGALRRQANELLLQIDDQMTAAMAQSLREHSNALKNEADARDRRATTAETNFNFEREAATTQEGRDFTQQLANDRETFDAKQARIKREFEVTQDQLKRAANEAFEVGEAEKGREFQTERDTKRQEFEAAETDAEQAFKDAQADDQRAFLAGESDLAREFRAEESALQRIFAAGESDLAREFRAEESALERTQDLQLALTGIFQYFSTLRQEQEQFDANLAQRQQEFQAQERVTQQREQERQGMLSRDASMRQQAASLIPELFPDLPISSEILQSGIDPSLIPVLIQLAQFRFAQQSQGMPSMLSTRFTQ